MSKSPGTIGTANRAKVQKSALRRTIPKYRKSHAAVQSAALTIYDRQDRIGSVVERDGQHLAYTDTGDYVGTFQSRREAMHAIPITGGAS